MIAKLRGLLDSTGEDFAIVDVGGVGYLVFASRRTLGRLGPAGSPVSLLVETHVREDHIHLYGFAERAERDWFRLLTTVQGVGARVALAILGVLSADQLTTAIAAQDRVALTRADGVGPKLAARILSELRDKVAGLSIGGVEPAMTAGIARQADEAGSQSSVVEDVTSALVNLGYARSDAFVAATRAMRNSGDGTDLGQVIRTALKELAL